MPFGMFILALMLAVQVAETRACPTDSPAAPAPSSPAPTTPAGEVFTTTDGVRFVVDAVVTNLEIPWSMAFAPDSRLFVTERPGRVRIIDITRRTSELALSMDDVFAEGEAGLLGLALDPQFAQTQFVYLYYSARVGGGAVNRVVRYREAGSRLAERAVLLDGIPAAQIHDGGRIRFGPDGLLYITAGDAANTSLAQDLGSLAGKILRINRDGTTPRENPFGSPVYSYGHRNPQGLDWHPATGQLWAVEHGNVGNDEVNAIDAGVNYGWPRIEGSQTMAGMRTPLTFYNPAIAPSGTSFYRGDRFPRFVNNVFTGTLRGTHLLRLVPDGSSPRITSQEILLNGRFGRLRDVVSGPDGFLYLATNNRDGRGNPAATDDRILRISPAP
jgi:glucose/arabinose dehydrogenase